MSAGASKLLMAVFLVGLLSVGALEVASPPKAYGDWKDRFWNEGERQLKRQEQLVEKKRRAAEKEDDRLDRRQDARLSNMQKELTRGKKPAEDILRRYQLTLDADRLEHDRRHYGNPYCRYQQGFPRVRIEDYLPKPPKTQYPDRIEWGPH